MATSDGKRKENKQRTKWRDEIGSFTGIAWNRLATDRDEGRRLGEAFVLQWTHRG